MAFTDKAPALTKSDKVAVCSTLIEIVAENTPVHPDACICTFFPIEPGQSVESIPYSCKRGDSEAMRRIRKHRDAMPVTDKMIQTGIPMNILQGTFQDYFKANEDNLVVSEEKIFVVKEGFTIAKSQYLAIPFPSGMAPQGIFFLFAHHTAELSILEEHLDTIVNCIETQFNV